ncbi:adenylate/guanylate cyclase domain-containing protein [Nocardia nova]|uniref:adenylate/guanylate cyclase domain-containing protein n=1 Tax=Nocardia nova TaxID=37330 RepID=UPI0037AC1F63
MHETGARRMVAFIDLAGFTAMTEVHGDHEAADLAERFTDLVGEQLAPDDRLVKTIGDAVLVTSPNAESGIALLRRIMLTCADTDGILDIRSGAHVGYVVDRNGDIFGATVNLAARIGAAAAGGRALVTEPLVADARHLGFRVSDRGKQSFRHVAQPVSIYELELEQPRRPMTLDPVCRMTVPTSNAAGTLKHGGIEYYFCSLACAGAFAAEPLWTVT